MIASKDKIRKIYEILPGLNCGSCGFGSCGQFARAAAEGRASPFGCRQNPGAGYKISEIIGAKVPAHSYRFQPSPSPPLKPESSLQDLKEQVHTLSQSADVILGRLEKLKARQ
jgi:Na+-translocating ferredoxin:NAD+ oxidoreductase RNF subunit RnfB